MRQSKRNWCKVSSKYSASLWTLTWSALMKCNEMRHFLFLLISRNPSTVLMMGFKKVTGSMVILVITLAIANLTQTQLIFRMWKAWRMRVMFATSYSNVNNYKEDLSPRDQEMQSKIVEIDQFFFWWILST